MYGVDSVGHRNGRKYRPKHQQRRSRLHETAHNQIQNIYAEKENDFAAYCRGKECGELFLHLQKGKRPAECL